MLGLPSLHGLFAPSSFSVGLFPCLTHAMRPFQMPVVGVGHSRVSAWATRCGLGFGRRHGDG